MLLEEGNPAMCVGQLLLSVETFIFRLPINGRIFCAHFCFVIPAYFHFHLCPLPMPQPTRSDRVAWASAELLVQTISLRLASYWPASQLGQG